jgi:hypothetical protein
MWAKIHKAHVFIIVHTSDESMFFLFYFACNKGKSIWRMSGEKSNFSKIQKNFFSFIHFFSLFRLSSVAMRKNP